MALHAHARSPGALLGLFALLGAAACGTQTIQQGDGTTSPTTSTGAGGTGGEGGSTDLPHVDITLGYQANTAVVNLAALPTTTFKATTVVRLSDVWAAGMLKDDTSTVTFDFEGDDGFHPSAKPACMNNITSAQLAQGFITPDTRALLWPDAFGLPGCYFVKLTAKITAVDK